jgi:RsiW-degrading membrane proteinase PrsW (M82 family)
MSGQDTSATPTSAGKELLRRPGAGVIVITILAGGVLGALGLITDQRIPLAIDGGTWVAISLAFWAAYGLVLLLLVRKPIRRANLFGIGAALALVWGGLAATDIAARANTAVYTIAQNTSPDAEGAWTTWLLAPSFEETIKTVGILLLALLPAAARFGPAAGLAIGALVGVSFQVVENWVFTIQAMEKAIETGGTPLQALVGMAFIRGVVGFFSHLVYSGVIGAAIGWVLLAPAGGRLRRLPVAFAAFAAMVGLHMFSNWTTTADAGLLYLGTMAVGLVVFVLVYRAVSRLDAEASATA